jgi:hypothetical protein
MDAVERAQQLCNGVHLEVAAHDSTEQLLTSLRACFSSSSPCSHASALRERAFSALHSAAPAPTSLPSQLLRKVYLCASCLEASLLLREGVPAQGAAALRLLDLAHMLCEPHALLRELTASALLLHAAQGAAAPQLPVLSPEAVAAAALAARRALTGLPIPLLALPTAAEFSAAALRPALPCCITGALVHWPALAPPAAGSPDRRWADLAYLWRAAGPRTVPVEEGCNAATGGYLAPGFALRLCTLGDFLCDTVAPSALAFLAGQPQPPPRSGVPYLAQHALFDACPQLAQDIATPDYIFCNAGAAGPLPHVTTQAWLGPQGTYTPFHTDPTHNMLAQVVGIKRVRLLAPQATPCMHAAPPPLQNTSTAPRGAFTCPATAAAAASTHPLLQQCPVKAMEAVLGPGDMLFIPQGWWHECEALSPSFSVSFWWD